MNIITKITIITLLFYKVTLTPYDPDDMTANSWKNLAWDVGDMNMPPWENMAMS